MAALDDLIQQISDPELRARIQQEADRLLKQKKFGLVFEEHIPECTPLWDIPIKRGSLVALKSGSIQDTYVVRRIVGDTATCWNETQQATSDIAVSDLVSVARFGQPIYPHLKYMDSVCNAPDSDLWHTLIEADNYHALQLLEYLYAGKVDCIYIDPPYNTGAKDWKYNNDYVDSGDSYRHSKWLSMMQKRLKLAKKLLNPRDSVLICTIDEKEYLHLGCLLEEIFPEARMQMVSSVINNGGTVRSMEFSRTDEYIFFIKFGLSAPQPICLSSEWMGQISNTTRTKLRWRELIRHGANGTRQARPRLFYPILVSEDGKKFIGVGDVLPIDTNRTAYTPPAGCKAIWPLHSDGTEGSWGYNPSGVLKLQKAGFVRLGNFTSNGMNISFLQPGQQKRLIEENLVVRGKREDGSIDIASESINAKFVPGTQWAIKSHNASANGSMLLQQIIGKRFPFPKSLYAVHDAIRFFVANKPNALIIDFFAGSGTTLHAVNLLNAEDGGKRRCIMVTNNEVSADESKRLSENGFKPGDAEWEKLGIARYVNWPRTVCTIEGHDINGQPEVW